MSHDFVPLRIHSRFSPLLGTIDPEEAGEALARAGYRAAAITDRGGLFGVARARPTWREKGVGLIVGAEVEVRFPIPGEKERLTVPYALTILAENGEGEERLGRFLERLHREDRPSGLGGIATAEELAEAAGGWIVMSGGLAGPVSGAYAAGRIGEAQRAAEFLAELFHPSRFFLETSRTGSPRERLVEPFLRRLEDRLGTPRLAADPIRVFREEDRKLLLHVRERFGGMEGGRIDPLLAEERISLSPAAEMARRYAEDPEPLRRTQETADRCLAGTTDVSLPGERGGERDEMIRIGLRGIDRLFGKEPRWRRREAEKRFWNELWRLEESGMLPAAVHLAESFRMVRRSESGALLHASLLSGGLIGALTGLQSPEGSGDRILAAADSHVPAAGGGPVRLEADPGSARLLPGVLNRHLPGGIVPALSPIPFTEGLAAATESPPPGPSEKGSGTSHSPPTRPPFDANARGNPTPGPFSGGPADLAGSLTVAFRREKRTWIWTERAIDLWRHDPSKRDANSPVAMEVRSSVLLGALRRGGKIRVEADDPLYALRRGKTAGLLEGSDSSIVARMRRLPPRAVSDLAVLLAASGGGKGRAELFDRIVKVRSGERQPPPLAEGFASILGETEGIPFFLEQLLDLIRAVSGRGWDEAEGLLRKMRTGNGAELAGDRSLFIRQAADRGASPARAARIFSVLLGLAPLAASRAEVFPVAERIARAAARKSVDPIGFACAFLNAAVGRREGFRDRMAAFEREGVKILPLDLNRSVFPFREEEGAIRTGLALLPGMDERKAARFIQIRERGGAFDSRADLLERLAGDRFPREDLLRLARAFRKEEGEAESAVNRETRSAAKKKKEKTASRRAAPASGRAGRKRRGVRGKKAASQTAFSFLERAERRGGRRAPAPSTGEREVS